MIKRLLILHYLVGRGGHPRLNLLLARVNLRLGATILVEVVLGLAADQILIQDSWLIVSGLGRIGEPG